MQRDADGDLFFGFCGARVYVPDDDPRAEGIADGVLRRFRERLAAELVEHHPAEDGRGRARLTEAGQNLLDAMAWL